MRIVSYTIESSITKNLGNYQSAKASISLTVSCDVPLTTEGVYDLFEVTFEVINAEMESQLTDQLIHAQRAVADQDKEAF